jgi:Zn-dependent M28 family amino/carboxypeptidase
VRPPPQPPVIWVRRALLGTLRAANQQFTAHLVTEGVLYPSVNIVGALRGTDPRLRAEYVEYSGHIDHDGVRTPIAVESIWNGAHDNGSVSVAMLAIGRAFVKHLGERSVIFVWHGAEELGLLGSRYFSTHPTVPLADIVAVLNGDMIGRNNPDTATILGVQPPHRNSTALVEMALAANERVTKFAIDSTWDRPSHPEGWYCRSDHIPYARLGIPTISFSTNLHADYHKRTDDPDRINYGKVTRMADWMWLGCRRYA